MRHWITCCVICLLVFSYAKASETILDPSAMKINSSLSDVKTQAGQWKQVKYGFEVINATNAGQTIQVVHPKWKAFTSSFTVDKPLLDGDEVTFSYCKTTDSKAGSLYIIFTAQGEYHAGLEIANDLSVGYFASQAKNRNKLQTLPTDVFQSKKDHWHHVRIVFHPHGETGGTYDLFIDDVNIQNGIGYAFSSKNFTDGLTLRGSTNDKGGREILLGAISVKRGEQTLEQFNRTAELSLSLSPIASEVGTVFVAGKPVCFD